MTSFDPQSASQTRAGVWEPSLDQHARLDAEMIRQTPWDPAAGRTGAGQGTDAAATRIDGEATNEGGRTRSQTTDGKPVLIDPLHQSAEVTITRERTAVEQGGQLYAVSDQLVIATGNGNDSVRVTPGSNGALALDVNGERYALDLAAGQEITIRGGDGDDTIEVAEGVTVNFVIESGDGDNTITALGAGDDRITGGAGRDTITVGAGNNYVDGGAGDDTIQVDGAGRNVLYGGDGADRITAGRGLDYVDGGAGDDRIEGVAGNNVLIGGTGTNTILTGTGNTRVYAGDDSTVINEGGEAVVYASEAIGDRISAENGGQTTVVNVVIDPALGRSLRIEGTDAFVSRVQADIDMLRASPNGQQMLAEFDQAAASGHVVTIRELQNEQNGYASMVPGYIRNGQAGPASDVTISYNPQFFLEDLPAPSVILYHEMSHAFNGVTGTFMPGAFTGTSTPDDARDAAAGVPNLERQAVGLPSSHPEYDYGNGRVTSSNPQALTENGMRGEMGLDLRPSYALP